MTVAIILTPNIQAPEYRKQLLMDTKVEILSNTIIGGLNAPLTSMGRSSRDKINNELMALSITVEIHLIGIFRTFHPKIAEYPVFKDTWNLLWDKSRIGLQNKPQEIQED